MNVLAGEIDYTTPPPRLWHNNLTQEIGGQKENMKKKKKNDTEISTSRN
jgi:hypothetical protein